MCCPVSLSIRGFLMLVLAFPVLAGEITSVAGTGVAQLNGHEGSTQKINVGMPFGVDFGPMGRLYVTEIQNHRILRIDLQSKRIQTVVGNGRQGYDGDGQVATSASLNEPYEVRFDRQGNMFFVEMQNHIVRKVDVETNIVSTIAGIGQLGFAGDDGLAIHAQFAQPHSICLDDSSGLYIADIGNHRIRKVDLRSGIVTSIAGTGEKHFPQEGKVAKGNPVLGPRALFFAEKSLWVALREGHSIWRIDIQTGLWHHLAGTGEKGFAGDGGPAKQAKFNGPKGIAVHDNRIYVVDTENQAIRMIDLQTNLVHTIAGTPPSGRGYGGDQGPATSARLDRPHGICADQHHVYIGDTLNHRVRAVSLD